MGWLRDEVWFDIDTDVLWFREQPRKPFAPLALESAFAATFEPALAPVANGLEESRRRRHQAQAARKRRLATRTVPAVALVLGSATMLPIAAIRHGGGGQGTRALEEDPPSLSFRLEAGPLGVAEPPFLRDSRPVKQPKPVHREPTRASELASVKWHRATSAGLPYGGYLVHGTQFPIHGPDWVTWNPVTDSVPNLPYRLYGNEHTIRTMISVFRAYRFDNPTAPRLVVGDISFRTGGTMDEHASHQNGLDVDVYYPRLDRHLSAPIATSQIDLPLAQDLLNRFVAAGAQMVFVGFSTGLRGSGGVVVPYPNHENHMHVRFPQPG